MKKKIFSKFFSLLVILTLLFNSIFAPLSFLADDVLASHATVPANNQVDKLEGLLFGGDPNTDWTPGNVCAGSRPAPGCYSDGEDVPHHLTFKNLVAATEYEVDLQHDYKDAPGGLVGYENFNDFAPFSGVTGGITVAAPVVAGDESVITYHVSFVAVGGDAEIRWDALLGPDAHDWNGASLHARLLGFGKKEIPVPVNELVDPSFGSITVVKDEVPDGNTEFTFLVNGPDFYGANFSLTDGNNVVLPDLLSGEYTITETNSAFPYTTSVSCTNQVTDNDENITFELGEDENVTCTFTNTLIPSTIKVYKETIPQDDGQTPFGVTLYNAVGAIGTEEPLTTSSPVTYNVEPGTYHVNETSKPDGWDETSNSCQDVFVGQGETEECVITNTKLGSIQGRKYYDVNGNGDFDQEEKDASGDPNRLNDWTINLYMNFGEDPVASLLTGHNGNKGQYRFEDLLPGTYYVCEVLQSGWTQTEPGDGCHEVQVGPGEDVAGIQFGNYELGSILGYKWNDGDGNISTTADRDPVENWVIGLWEDIFGFIGDTTTASDGSYSFTDLLAGNYEVKEAMQSDWVSLSLESIIIPLVPGQVSENNDFTNFILGYISGHKYNDLNGDGDWDKPGEPAVEGWEIYAKYPGGAEYSSTTDSNGLYNFPDLVNGTYKVYEKIGENPGWVQTAPAGDEYVIDMTSNAVELDNPNYDFGNKQNPVKIKAYKVVCDSEDLLPNWGNHGSTIDANTAQNYVNDNPGCSLAEDWQFQWGGIGSFGVFQTDTSLLSGSWNTFTPADTVEIFDTSNLGGKIEVREVFPNNDYVPFSNAGDVSAEFYCTGDVYNYDNWEWINNPQYGQTYYCVGFNALNKGTITVLKDVDADGDGDVDIFGTNRWTWTINGRGDFRTGDTHELLAGTYLIAENQVPGYHVTGLDCGREITLSPSESTEVLLDPGEDITCTFTNTRDTGSIYGRKWNDENGNGIWDEGEGTLGDWTIELYENNGGIMGNLVATTQTTPSGQSLGHYSFIGVPARNYFVCEVVEGGWEQIYPEGCHEITLEGNDDSIRGVDFGNLFKVFDVSIVKTNDKSGGAAVNDTVTYTLVTTNNGNQAIYDVIITDALPGGFSYVIGSAEVDGIPQEPTQPGGLLSWNVGTLGLEDPITIVYQATIASDIDQGVYTNLATCKGIAGKTLTVVWENGVLAVAEPNGETEPVTIWCNIADSSVPIGINFTYSDGLRGEVLGAATELPATGNDTKVLIMLLTMLALGASLKVVSYNMAEEKERKNA